MLVEPQEDHPGHQALPIELEVEKGLMTLQVFPQDTFSDTWKFHKFARKILAIYLLINLIAISLSSISIDHFDLTFDPKITKALLTILSLISLIFFVLLTVDNNFGKKDSRKYFILGYSIMCNISSYLLCLNDIAYYVKNPQIVDETAEYQEIISILFLLILKYLKNVMLMQTIFFLVAFLFTLQTRIKFDKFTIYVVEVIFAILSYFLIKTISPETISPLVALIALATGLVTIFLINLLASNKERFIIKIFILY
jgi:hypothetical protein